MATRNPSQRDHGRVGKVLTRDEVLGGGGACLELGAIAEGMGDGGRAFLERPASARGKKSAARGWIRRPGHQPPARHMNDAHAAGRSPKHPPADKAGD